MTEQLTRPNYLNMPVEACRQQAQPYIDIGCEVHQKFSCSKCGQRLTVDRPNTWFSTGTCDQCGHMTNIERAGCNFVIIAKTPALVAQVRKMRKLSR